MRIDLNQRNNPRKVSSVGLKHLEELINMKLAAFKVLAADALFKWEVPDNGAFGSVKHPFWSGYFRANWDVSIGTRNTEPVLPASMRPPHVALDPDMERAYEGNFQPNRVLDTLAGKGASEIMAKPILIYNNTWYGKWLNNGGYNAATYLKTWPPSRVTKRRKKGGRADGAGSRFMERGYNYMARTLDYSEIIREARVNYGKYVKKG